MGYHAVDETEFDTEIFCVKCGQSGLATWARNLLRKNRSVTATSSRTSI